MKRYRIIQRVLVLLGGVALWLWSPIAAAGAEGTGDATTGSAVTGEAVTARAGASGDAAMDALLQSLGGPPLTIQQWYQLQDAEDGDRQLDSGAWYALWANAATWPDDLRQGVTVPDYRAIAENPRPNRGRLFVVEGDLVQATPLTNLARRSEYPDAMQWVIRPGERNNIDTVVVYLVDPPAVEAGERVRAVARFYKLWQDADARRGGQTAYFLTFVGKTGSVVGPTDTDSPPGKLSVATVAVILVVSVAALIFMARRAMKLSLSPRPLQSRMLGPRRLEEGDEGEAEEQEVEPLPEDPSEAMSELDRRRESVKVDWVDNPEVLFEREGEGEADEREEK